MMRDTPLTRLVQCGQSIWLDGITRPTLLSGELISLVQEDGVSGVSLNAAALEGAVAGGRDYDGAIADLARQGLGAAEICETLATQDARLVADLLHPLYERLDGRDGYVSLGLSPHLAYDGTGTLMEARRLWELVDRPNLMVAIPGTCQGVAVLRELVREGINVNLTLIFGVPRYLAAAEAYLDGLSQRAARGLPLAGVASVASLFMGRIDATADAMLSRLARQESAPGKAAEALKGKIAIACAKACLSASRKLHSEDRYLALAGRGARPQRLLWSVAGARGHVSDELHYVEALIGPGTVTGMTRETLALYRERANPASRVDDAPQEALAVLERVHGLGVDLAALAQRLEEEGVERLGRPYDSLMRCIELKRLAALGFAVKGFAIQEGSRE